MIKDFLIAMGNYNKYGELLSRRRRTVAAYVTVLILVCSIGLVIVPTLRGGTKFVKALWSEIPEFTITHEGMTIDEPFDLELGGTKIFATTDVEVSETDFGKNITGFLLDADTVILRNMGKTASFSYSDFDFDGEGFVFTKNDLLLLKPYIIAIAVVTNLILIVSLALLYLINALFVAAVSNLIAVAMRIFVPLGRLYVVALYAKTLPFVLKAVLYPFGIQMYSFLAFIITMFIIVMFLKSLRQDCHFESI